MHAVQMTDVDSGEERSRLPRELVFDFSPRRTTIPLRLFPLWLNADG